MQLETLNHCNLCGSDCLSTVDDDRNIGRCEKCGFIFDNPRPKRDEIERFYSANNRYDEWIEEEEGRNSLWKRRLDMIKKYQPAGSLLDIGSGIAQFLSLARNDFDISGTEISKSAIRIAKEKFNINLNMGGIEEVDFDSQFDVITLFHSLEHVPNPSATIERCKQLLKTGGFLFVAVPNDTFGIKKTVIRGLSILRIGKFKEYGNLGLPRLALDGSQKEIHLSHFRAEVLASFLKSRGFAVIENGLDPYYSVGGMKKLLHRGFYSFSLVFLRAFGKNIYPTIWMVAKKRGDQVSL